MLDSVLRKVESFPRLKQWIRHHTSAVFTTVVDFLAMISAVEVLGLSPVPATALGAGVGAVTNFLLLRYWTYQRSETAAKPQMFRYFMVASVSLALNTGGEHLLFAILNVQYILARVVTAVIVSNAWNYPMQRFVVFADRKVPA